MKRQHVMALIWPILFVVISFLLLGIKFATEQANSANIPMLPSGYQNAIWEWTPPQAANTRMFSALKADNITTIFLDISTYIDAFELPQGPERDGELRVFSEACQVYIQKAHEQGVRVQALAGGPLWGQTSHRYQIDILLDFIREYNAAHPEAAFQGLQLDIEPYAIQNYWQQPSVYMVEYLDTIEQTVQKLAQQNFGVDQFAFGLAIPYWYDGQITSLPKLVWQAEEKFTFNHLVKIINQYPNSYLAIMAYRNFALGENGAIDAVQYELEFISTYAPKLGVYIGQEITDIQPRSITFFGKTTKDVKNQTLKISEFFENKKQYYGIVINDMDGYIAFE